MTSREIVRRTLDFDGPERVARSFYGSDLLRRQHGGRTRLRDWVELASGWWELIDEWGNTWSRIDAHTKGEVSKGVLADWGDLDTYELPDYSDSKHYENIRRARREHPDKWLIGALPGFAFNIARKMRRMEQYLVDLMLEPDRVGELHDRIDAVLEQEIRNYADAGADCVMFAEDWGTQTQLLIRPDLFRREFLPRFEKLCAVAHDCGVRVFMHSCGQTEEVLPDMIAAGIDLFQFDQPDLHGIDRLAPHQARAKVSYWCPVDIQTVLQTRDEATVRASARELLDKLWKGRGGFIAGYYGDNPSIGLSPEVQEWASDEFIEHGVQASYREA